MTAADDHGIRVRSAQSAQRPRVVMLTTGTRHAAGILAAMQARGLRPDAIILERAAGRDLLARVRESWRRQGIGVTLAAIFRRLRARLQPGREPWRNARFYRDRTDRLIPVGSLTGDEAVAALQQLQPDLLLLAGAPILPPTVLATARLGVLNAHPGLLPAYRGVDVVAHAVLDDAPVGATVHLVDSGIDTGGIVTRVEVPLQPGDTLDSLQARVEMAGAHAMADAVATILRGEDLAIVEQAGRLPLRRRLPGNRRREAERRLHAVR